MRKLLGRCHYHLPSLAAPSFPPGYIVCCWFETFTTVAGWSRHDGITTKVVDLTNNWSQNYPDPNQGKTRYFCENSNYCGEKIVKKQWENNAVNDNIVFDRFWAKTFLTNCSSAMFAKKDYSGPTSFLKEHSNFF